MLWVQRRLMTSKQLTIQNTTLLRKHLLEDDKEYIDAINEASRWGSRSFMRRLFATLMVLG